MADDITVLGADWCGDTRRTLRHLDRKGIIYTYVDIEEDEIAEARVIAFSNGKRRIPLVEVGSKSLAVPSESELDAALGT